MAPAGTEMTLRTGYAGHTFLGLVEGMDIVERTFGLREFRVYRPSISAS